MCRYDEYPFRGLRRVHGLQSQVLDGSYRRKYLGAGNADRLISRSLYLKRIFRIGLFLDRGVQTVIQRRGSKLDRFCLSGRVGGQLFQLAVRDSGLGDRDGSVSHRTGGDIRCNINLQPPFIRSVWLGWIYDIHISTS